MNYRLAFWLSIFVLGNVLLWGWLAWKDGRLR